MTLQELTNEQLEGLEKLLPIVRKHNKGQWIYDHKNKKINWAINSFSGKIYADFENRTAISVDYRNTLDIEFHYNDGYEEHTYTSMEQLVSEHNL